ncbi:hypothetical protein D9M70_602510 [compost metagenome]
MNSVSTTSFSGSFMCSYASSSTRCDSVAENSSVCRVVRSGMRRSRKRMSLMKPRSNMRSASSSTHISQACRLTTLCCLT